MSLCDYETSDLKLCAKRMDFFNTICERGIAYEIYKPSPRLRQLMGQIPEEVFVLYIGSSFLYKLNTDEGSSFVRNWFDMNAFDFDDQYEDDSNKEDSEDGGIYSTVTPEFLRLTRFFFQPKVSVLSSAVRGGQLNLCTSKFILSYLFGDETSSWDYDSDDFKIQWANMSSYMDHMVFDFYKKPTACIKL